MSAVPALQTRATAPFDVRAAALPRISAAEAKADRLLAAELAAAIVRKGYGLNPPLLAAVLAGGIAERIVRALHGSGFLEVIAWVEAVCERYALRREVISMLEAACAIVRPSLRARRDLAGSIDGLATLEGGIQRAIERYVAREVRSTDYGLADVEAAMAALLVRLDDADPASAEHSRAVSLWCRRIARRLALDDDACSFAARCGLLHDVGKTKTPKDILSAPRGLSSAEWVVMREHTELGAAMIREIPLLRPFTSAARWHHERLDGKGYPDALPAKEIPLHVRIVSVADSFNAMIGRRPYRLPMAPSAALEQLIANRGTQFDPMIVEAMIEVVTGRECA
ncbi:MAG: HD domain-containing protein [Candidatus Eremiobacteraeota bacterium]|nr:HD domain-containing protein [Candidatus Eremiobacteraeota bacterium]